jgi:hypothetical protein
MENTYLTKIPEIDMHILDHMSDESLVQYVQTSKFSKELVQIPKINQRIETFKKYITFDIFSVINENFDNIIYRPYILFKIKNQTYNIKIFYPDYYVSIKYTMVDTNITLSINRINQKSTILEDDDLDARFGFDINTLYMIYVHEGFHKYAEKATQEYLDKQYNKMALYKNTLDGFFNLMGLYLWFKINCIFLYLTKDSLKMIDNQEITLEYINSNDGTDTMNRFKNYITLYYDLLTDYIENL